MAKKAFQSNDLFNSGYELENVWEPVGAPQKLTANQIKDIQNITIKKHTLEDGTELTNAVIFFNNGRKPTSFKVSPYSKAVDYPNGTNILPASLTLQAFKNQDGQTTITCECRAL